MFVMFVLICSLLQLPALFLFHFFFQAEDGIRDTSVTGVQTCALPISWGATDMTSICSPARKYSRAPASSFTAPTAAAMSPITVPGKSSATRSSICENGSATWWLTYARWSRSEERRVGQEGRCREVAGE